MKLSEDELERLIALITERTGIIPRSSHRDGIRNFVEKKLNVLGVSASFYFNSLFSDTAALEELVNESTVNETYFFREEKQFAFIRDKLFPLWLSKFGVAPIKIWSAACSYGEEAYSLALLARSCLVKAEIIASDINTKALDCCRAGVFKPSSVRGADGESFEALLAPFRDFDGRIVFDKETRAMVTTRHLNLAELDSPFVAADLPRDQNIVFLRNVFIYFSPDFRSRVLRTVAEKCLRAGGYLFVSMSEIAQLDGSLIPACLEKIVDGNIFYFRKKI